jgi:hypothetical protein
MTTRTKAGIVAGFTLILLIALGTMMTQRIIADLRQNPPSYFIFQEVTGTDFGFAGRHVSFTDTVKNNVPYLTLKFGDESRDLLVAKRAKQDLPGLADHTEWLRVLRFVDATGMRTKDALGKVQAGRLADRLIVVTKSLRPGVNQETWGEVWKRDWEFDFYELHADGSISHERLGYPSHKKGEPPKPSELRQNSWQYTAALHLMPKGGPTLDFRESTIKAAGWTLTAAAVCCLVLIGCIVVAYRKPAAPSLSQSSGSGGESPSR